MHAPSELVMERLALEADRLLIIGQARRTEGATHSAADTVQVADRFHLLHNLTDAARHALGRHQRLSRGRLPGRAQRGRGHRGRRRLR